MAYVQVPDGLPGISGLLAAFPETGGPLGAFTQALLRGPSSLSAGERELIASFVSSRQNCFF